MRLLPLALLFLPALGDAEEIRRQTDPATGIERIEVDHPGFSLRLLPLNPDFVVAVFSARGLPKDIAESTRNYCSFGTVMRNTGDQPLHYDLRDWRYVTPDGKTHRVKTKTEWMEEWKHRSLAFRWILLHEEQTWQPGDWGQGFTTVPLPAGSRFDLYYSWEQGGKRHDARIPDIRCAPEKIPEKAPTRD
ncbi:MAG TPA: hypothetical protein ENJ79_09530 [Gammaproteobacteria bacterium]|nr:hypothetical protein [Gammaproteobacteria bacterium]